MRWLAALVVSACASETGTIQLELTTAPGSTLLDGVERLRVTLTDPPFVVEAPRVDDGFDLVIDVEATDTAGALIVEGFDAGGAVIATGASPPFAVSAINARVVVYLATPLTIGRAPTALPATRTGVASTRLSYGFALAGGEFGGTRTDSIFIYNAYDHTLVAGLAMPEPRSHQTLATGSNDSVYLFGGRASDGTPSGSLWRFDTTVQPSGAFAVQPEQVALARAGASAVPITPEHFVITGDPPIDLDFGVATARTDAGFLGAGAGLVLGDRGLGVFAGAPARRFEDDVFEAYPVSTVLDAAAAVVGETVVFSTDTTKLLVLDPTTAASTGTTVDALSVERQSPAIAATSRFVVIAGGRGPGNELLGNADILDATTLARLATVPCMPRAGATAHPLPNGQIAIVGGDPANDAIELFTPPAP